MSLPSRERGLKFSSWIPDLSLRPSLPSRERGLKFKKGVKGVTSALVAPLAGAWIEILMHGSRFLLGMSLPSRERGLKF